jgi:hypothetical protein
VCFLWGRKIVPQRNVQFTAKKIGGQYKTVQVFQISISHLKILGAQLMNMKQVQSSAPTNVSRHHTELCRPDGLMTEICVRLVSQSNTSINSIYAASIWLWKPKDLYTYSNSSLLLQTSETPSWNCYTGNQNHSPGYPRHVMSGCIRPRGPHSQLLFRYPTGYSAVRNSSLQSSSFTIQHRVHKGQTSTSVTSDKTVSCAGHRPANGYPQITLLVSHTYIHGQWFR